MNVVVTGAAGFLGSECVRQLREGGHAVLTTDRVGQMDCVGDLANPTFARSLPDAQAVVHCAAVQYVSQDLPLLARQRYFHSNNVLATLRLCERYSGTGTHMVNIGTSMMYRQCGLPVYGTDSPMQGQGVYSQSKLDAWGHVQRSFPDAATVMPCIIGGIGREGLFRGFVKSIGTLGFAVFPGSGTHKTHMVHVHDVAALAMRVVEVRAKGLFNAAAPDPLSICDWVQLVSDELRLPQPRTLQLPLRPLHALSAMTGYRILAREQLLMLAQAHVLDTDSSRSTGWQPRFDNERIVRDIASYIARAAPPMRAAREHADK